MQQDGKRADGTTLLPWARGKPMAWEFTVSDNHAESHMTYVTDQTDKEACSGANKAAANIAEQVCKKYGALSAVRGRQRGTHFLVTVEPAGSWHLSDIELIQDFRKLVEASLQPRKTDRETPRRCFSVVLSPFRLSSVCNVRAPYSTG